jgi:ribonuclease E
MDKNKMLIDATHPEETRVVALRNGRVEEFDFESAARKLLRGNIYLAKVTRVEPSLQAAFIDYGGNRHGFLAFNEIHPDYYQIPVADREALKQEEAEAELQAEEEADERARSRGPRNKRRRGRGDRSQGDGNGQRHDGGNDPAAEIDTFEDGYQTSGSSSADSDDHSGAGDSAALTHSRPAEDVTHGDLDAPPSTERSPAEPIEHDASAGPAFDSSTARSHFEQTRDWPAEAPDITHAESTVETDAGERYLPAGSDDSDADDANETNGNGDDDQVEQVATEEDALEELPERPRRRARQYKIQEVIKRRQVMLVQVVKEERGNKGAALTTYISLAGRYTVLMPNTARGGGISRKITQPQDRKRLKAIAEELDVPEGMGLIIRTAGAARTKQEIRRDYEYLLRLWESVRDLTLSSTAPCLVYEEGNIIKRAIRDLYSKDFDQIVVAGDVAHREAQNFMEMLMPGSGSHVASYHAPEPLFARYGIERQLNALFSPYVTLRSGGYIVINQTEALVSVDVNSGKSTREFSIEETALNTNLEAAEEIARQLKLRDLAGLIVVDFIDMEEKRNNRSVERRLKDALRFDRARIQVGRISHFGLLEMSRQRLRAGVLEGSTSQCPHCQGTGIIRSIESVSLAVLRGLEDHLLKQPSSLAATTTAEVALYILNHKRAYIAEMERRHGVTIRVEASDRMQGANFGIERIAAPVALARPASRTAVSMEWGFDRDEHADDDVDDAIVEAVEDEPVEAVASETAERAGSGSEEERRGRRRRRRRGRRDREGDPRQAVEQDTGSAESDAVIEASHGETGHDEAGTRDDEHGSHSHVADSGVDLDDDHESEAEAAETAGEAGEPAEGAGGDQRRRGRRRGRRGGRARRRDGATDLPVDGQEGDALRTGALSEGGDGHAWGVLGSVDGPGTITSDNARPMLRIVETIGEPEAAGSVDTAISPADQALRLAVQLASPGTLEPETAPMVAVAAPIQAPPVAMPPPVAAPPSIATPSPVITPPPVAMPRPVARIIDVSVEDIPAAPVPETAPERYEATVPDMVMEAPAMPTSAGKQEPSPEAVASQPAGTNEAFGSPSQEPLAATIEVAIATSVSSYEDAKHESGRNGAEGAGHHPAQSERVESDAMPAPTSEAPRPSRRGWWQRRFGGAE